MATATKRKRTRDVEPVEEDAFEELEDAEDDEPEEDEPAAKPAKRTRAKVAKAAPAPAEANGDAFNTAWLAEHVSEVTGETFDSRSLRMLLRKMANAGELERVVGEDRGRYTFPKGANDPIVKAVVRKVKSGEMKVVKQESLAKVKETAAAKPAKRAKKATEMTDEAPAETTRTRKRRRGEDDEAAAPAKATRAKRRKD